MFSMRAFTITVYSKQKQKNNNKKQQNKTTQHSVWSKFPNPPYL